jgi:hypothetical protein
MSSHPTVVFEKAAFTVFDNVGIFAGAIFWPDTFTRFTEGLVPASCFLFLAAASHASEPGSKHFP